MKMTQEGESRIHYFADLKGLEFPFPAKDPSAVNSIRRAGLLRIRYSEGGRWSEFHFVPPLEQTLTLWPDHVAEGGPVDFLLRAFSGSPRINEFLMEGLLQSKFAVGQI